MKYALILGMFLALPAAAQNLPEGLEQARFLPGWTNAQGQRVAALELVLEPGWKTYWRSPGDAGLPPEFEWQGSNIGKVEFHWPAPEVIESGGLRTLGYHEKLVLPFTVTPQNAGQPIGLSAKILFGLCENICIPAELSLVASPPADSPDPVIEQAIAAAPATGKDLPACEIGQIEDGMTVTLSVPQPGADLAIEYGADPKIWVSAPDLSPDGSEATADFVDPSGKPFPLDPAGVILTVLAKDGATEYRGCTPPG